MFEHWLQISGELEKNPIRRREEKWSKPLEGEVKINVDASYSDDDGH
jgi:hypothetical protein